MAKIDVSTIEGFADMTAEQKAEALANYEFPDPDYGEHPSVPPTSVATGSLRCAEKIWK